MTRGAVGTLLLALGATASAQDPGYDAHGFTLVPGDGHVLDPLQTWRGGHPVADGWAVEVLGERVETPLGAFAPQPDGTYVGQSLADDLLGVNIGLAWAPSSRLGLSLALLCHLRGKLCQQVQDFAQRVAPRDAGIGLRRAERRGAEEDQR